MMTHQMSSSSSEDVSSATTTATAVDHTGGTTISAVHQDIIQTHILARLDGPTLAATACASPQLHALSTEDRLWREICAATWPSINHPRISHVISTFPAGHRSFFSDSFPLLDHRQRSGQNIDRPSKLTTELISCVDIYYKNSLIISKTHEMETVTDWFQCSPFRAYLLETNESVPTPVLHGGENGTWLKDLAENLSMSWLLIDPSQKRAVNISSGRPVSVERHWLTGDVQARFATIMAGDRRPETELVNCEVAVTCGGKEGVEVHVREVSMQVEDMEGRCLSGKDSLVILREAMANGKRKRARGNEGKERYDKFVERKRETKEKKEKRERFLDMVCIAIGITVLMACWSFLLFR